MNAKNKSMLKKRKIASFILQLQLNSIKLHTDKINPVFTPNYCADWNLFLFVFFIMPLRIQRSKDELICSNIHCSIF